MWAFLHSPVLALLPYKFFLGSTGLDKGGGGEIAPGPHIAFVVLLLSLVIPVETLQD